MSIQYDRQLSAVVATDAGQGIDFANFRCIFEIRRGDTQTPNTGVLRILNLNDSTANAISQAEFTKLTIKAGYPGNFGQIFTGNIKQQRKGRISQLDTYVEITAGDGDQAYNFSTINVSLPAGTQPTAVQKALLDAMKPYGITQGYAPNFPTNALPRGQVLFGSTKDIIRKFAEIHQCSWSIQDDKLVFIPLTSYISGDVVTVSPDTGLLGSPEQIAGGISMRMLLNPSIKVGSAIKLQGATVNQFQFSLNQSSQAQNTLIKTSNQISSSGLYYVMNVSHNGDTRGGANSWTTEIICLSIDATIPSSETTNALNATDAAIRIFN